MGDSPLGPFTEAPNSPILVTDKTRDVVSPGHHALFTRGGRDYILYHRHSVPYVPEQAYRQTCVDEIQFTTAGLIEKVVPTHTGPTLAQGRKNRNDLAKNAIATASTELDGLHNASRVLDDNYATQWRAANGQSENWLQLDLGTVKNIARSELRFEYAWKNYRFTLQSSTDGKTWTTLADHHDQGTSGSPLIVNSTAECRYLKLIFAPAGKDETTGIIEWAVY